MNRNLSDAQLPSDLPKPSDMRRGMIATFSSEQLSMIAAWLGMEAVESGSDEVFQCGRRLLGYAALKGSEGLADD